MADTLTHESATHLLDKLANDDGFREHLLGDPVAAMASVGVKVDPASVPHVRKLPSKEEIKANAAAMKEKLHGKSGMVFFVLA
ncbi:MAG: NHLP-related RiPP peptide [Lysobacterales bacterium]